MRVPDYNLPIKVNGLSQKKRRVEKIREEEFEKELEGVMHQKEPKTKEKSISPPRFIGNRTSWV